MRYLRTNTATRVTVGCFLDNTDGVTPETGLTVTNEKLTLVVDVAGVPTLVLDVAPTASGGNNDMVHITNDDAGFYDLELTAANLNYLGRAMLSLTDATNHCPVFHEFMILPANVYDSLVLGTDLLDSSLVQVNGAAQTATLDTIKAETALIVEDTGTTIPGTITTIDNEIATIDGIVDDILEDTGTTLDGKIDTIDGIVDSILEDSGTTLNALLVSIESKVDVVDANVDLVLADTGTYGVLIADDAITSAKYDESTAFPLKYTDSGSTELARTGADADTLETISDEIAGVITLGSGAITWDYNVKDALGSNLPDVTVWVTSDSGGNILLASGTTDADGDVTFYLDAGTVYVWCQKSGYNFSNPDTEVVA